MEVYLLICGFVLGVGFVVAIQELRKRPDPQPVKKVYDYDITDDTVSLRDILGLANAEGHEIIAVLPHGSEYLVVFRRSVNA